MALTASDENRNLMRLYQEVILIHNSEKFNKENKIEVSRTHNIPTGRQTGVLRVDQVREKMGMNKFNRVISLNNKYSYIIQN